MFVCPKTSLLPTIRQTSSKVEVFSGDRQLSKALENCGYRGKSFDATWWYSMVSQNRYRCKDNKALNILSFHAVTIKPQGSIWSQPWYSPGLWIFGHIGSCQIPSTTYDIWLIGHFHKTLWPAMTHFRWWICARDRCSFLHHPAQAGFSWSLSKLKWLYIIYLICMSMLHMSRDTRIPAHTTHTTCRSWGAMAQLVEVGSILLVVIIDLSSLRMSWSCGCYICNFGGNLMGGHWVEPWKLFQAHGAEWIYRLRASWKTFCTWYVLRLYVAHQRGVHFIIEQPLTSVWTLHIAIMMNHQLLRHALRSCLYGNLCKNSWLHVAPGHVFWYVRTCMAKQCKKNMGEALQPWLFHVMSPGE